MLMYILYFLSFVDTFTLISINTQSLRNSNRRQAVFNLIKENKHDVIYLQETHWTDDLKNDISREWGGNVIFNNFEPTARGTAILFHLNFDYRNHNSTCDSQGRTIQAVIEHSDHKLHLINGYAPRTDAECRNYFMTIPNFLTTTDTNILGGDFNCI